MRPAALAVAVAAATGVQVGASLVASRYVMADLGPASVALLRYGIGVLCLLPLLLLRGGGPAIARRDLPALTVLGILQFGVLIALLNFSLLHVTAARTALIFSAFPLLTLLLGAALGREAMSRAKVGGVLLTILGVGLALGEKALARGEGAWIGEAAAFAAACCGATTTVMFRPYMQRYDAIPVGTLAMLASVAVLLLPSLGEGLPAALPRLGAGQWAAMLFIGISSGVFFALWLWALRHATASRVTVFQALSPVTATILGAVLLAEPLTPGVVAGLAAVAAGLVVAHR